MRNILDSINKVVNLEKEEFFIEQYVNLRNNYCELLLTEPVNILETKQWFKRKDIEVRGIAHGTVLLGAVVLYLIRNGEVAFFVRHEFRGKGIGSALLNIIEKAAEERKLNNLWAWVLSDNISAQKTFVKNGYVLGIETERMYRGEKKRGVVFNKKLLKQQKKNAKN